MSDDDKTVERLHRERPDGQRAGLTAEDVQPPYLAISQALNGLSDDTLARISCWNTAPGCGHPRAEHELVVQALLEAGWDSEHRRQRDTVDFPPPKEAGT